MDWNPPTRSYPPQVAAVTRNSRLIRTEAELLRAITLAYQKPTSLSVLELAADIHLSQTLSLTNAPTGFNGFLLDGSGQYTISNSVPLSVMFDVGAPLTMRDVLISATGVTRVFNIASDVETRLSGLTLATSADGYVFGLTGDHRNTLIEDTVITDDGSLTALVTASATNSQYWVMRNVKLYGVNNVLDNAHGTNYLYISIDGLSVDPTTLPLGATLSAQVFGSVIENTQNVSTINLGTGSNNELKHNRTSILGTMKPGNSDLVLGAAGYTVDPTGVAAFLGHSNSDANGMQVVFPNGLSVGGALTTNDTVYEQTKVATLITVLGTAATAFSFTALTDTAYYVEADILARQTGSASECNVYKIARKVKNNGGTLTAGTFTTLYADEEVAGWDATIDTSGTQIRVRVTGAAATNIRWGVVTRVRRI